MLQTNPTIIGNVILQVSHIISHTLIKWRMLATKAGGWLITNWLTHAIAWDFILGLEWLKNWINFGMRTPRDWLSSSELNWSEQSSHILCSALNAPCINKWNYYWSNNNPAEQRLWKPNCLKSHWSHWTATSNLPLQTYLTCEILWGVYVLT